MPMCMLEFRFDGPAPCEAYVAREIDDQLGARGREIVEIGAVDDRVRVLSTDPLSLVYAAKVIQGLGGSITLLSGHRARIRIPAWAEIRWREHGFLRRLRIRLGGVRMQMIPSAERDPTG